MAIHHHHHCHHHHHENNGDGNDTGIVTENIKALRIGNMLRKLC
jgi:hypothetical protein